MKKSYVISIGITFCVVVGLLIFGLNFLMGKNLFVDENYYYAIYDKIDGLTVGSPVMISGYKVGQVRDINFMSTNSKRLLIKIATNKNYKIIKNAQAELYSSDLMGTKAIKIIHGQSTEFHAQNDTIKGIVEGELIDMVSTTMLPLKIKTESMLSSVDSVLMVIRYVFNESTQENLAKSFTNINKTIRNLEFATAQINEVIVLEREKLDVILSNFVSITTNLRNNNEMLTKAIANFEAISDSVKASEIKSTINNANQMMAQLNEITTRINKGEGLIGELLHNDTLYTHLQSVTYNLNRLIKDLHDNPKRYIHFSAFDLGKTIVVDEEKGKKEMKKRLDKIEEKKSIDTQENE